MPYIPSDKPFAEMERLLRGYGLTTSRFARVLGKCEATARYKLRNPGYLTLYDLQRVCREAHIPAEEIRGAVKFQ